MQLFENSKMENYYIPSEILVEFMKRLPLKSLMRSKSVSKHWKSVIDSSKLIFNNQVINHVKPQHGLLVGDFVKKDGCNKLHGYVVDDDGIFPQHKFSLTLPVDRPILIGLSQGLLCFYSQHAYPDGLGSIGTAVIGNPSINKTVAIDVPDVLDTPHNYTTVFGFGVCPRTSEPKLVKIICSRKITKTSKKFKSFPERVRVFTLSSGVFPLTSGYWRRPLSSSPRKSISFTHNQVVIDVFIYWLASDLIDDSHMIVSFHTPYEKFAEVYLPDGLTRGDILISKLRESLVVLENSYGSNPRVWMMQNGYQKSFAPIFTINTPNVSISNVLGFRKSGEPIIVIKNDTEVPGVYLYDPNSEEISYIGIPGKFHSIFAASYKQSLLLLDKTDCHINFDTI